MRRRPPSAIQLLTHYSAVGLLIVGGLEWFLGRVVSRFAAVPPLEGIGRTIVETLGGFGLFLISTSFIFAAVLYFATALSLGERSNRLRRVEGLGLGIYLTLFGVFLVAHAILTALRVFGDEAWLSVTFNLLSLIAMWWLAIRFLLRRVRAERTTLADVAFKVGVLLVALAYSGWYYSVLAAWLSNDGTSGAFGPADVLRLGELMAVLAPVAFFVGIALPKREWRNVKRWVVPVLLLLLFAGGNIADIATNEGYTGVFAIWSVGFTLWLPWPLYGISLALFVFTVITCFAVPVPPDERRKTKDEGLDTRYSLLATRYSDMNRGLGLLLLLFAEFYLQLTYQHLLALLAVMLLTGLARPFAVSARPSTVKREDEDSAQPAAEQITPQV